MKICLINYEDLISQYITALHKNDTDIFIDRLLETDLLIVDNMQFVAGKNYTQEDIASWVNKMILMGKTVSNSERIFSFVTFLCEKIFSVFIPNDFFSDERFLV